MAVVNLYPNATTQLVATAPATLDVASGASPYMSSQRRARFGLYKVIGGVETRIGAADSNWVTMYEGYDVPATHNCTITIPATVDLSASNAYLRVKLQLSAYDAEGASWQDGTWMTYTDATAARGSLQSGTLTFKIVSITTSDESTYLRIGSGTYLNPDFSLQGTLPPEIPTNLAASKQFNPSLGFVLTWATSNYSTNYEIYRGTSPNPTQLLTTVGNVSTYTDSGLSSGTYYYRIKGKNSSGTSGYSNEIQVTTAPTGTISNLTATRLNTTSKYVDLAWTKIAGATGYNIYRGTSTNPTQLLASVGDVATYRVDEGSFEGTAYYRVTGTQGVFETEYSNNASATLTYYDMTFHQQKAARYTDVFFTTPVDEAAVSNIANWAITNGIEVQEVHTFYDAPLVWHLFYPAPWTAKRGFHVGEFMVPRATPVTDYTMFWVAQNDGLGTTGTEPTWNRTFNATTVDNQVTWKCLSGRQFVRIKHTAMTEGVAYSITAGEAILGRSRTVQVTSAIPTPHGFRFTQAYSVDSEHTVIRFNHEPLASTLIEANLTMPGGCTIVSITKSIAYPNEVIIRHSSLNNGTHRITVGSGLKSMYGESYEAGYQYQDFTVSTTRLVTNGLKTSGLYHGIEVGVQEQGTVVMAYVEDTSATTSDLSVFRSRDGQTWADVRAPWPSNAPAFQTDHKYFPNDVITASGKTFRVLMTYGYRDLEEGKSASVEPTWDTAARHTTYSVTTMASDPDQWRLSYIPAPIDAMGYGVSFLENTTVLVDGPFVEDGKRIWIIQDLEPMYRDQYIEGDEDGYYKVNDGSSDSNTVTVHLQTSNTKRRSYSAFNLMDKYINMGDFVWKPFWLDGTTEATAYQGGYATSYFSMGSAYALNLFGALAYLYWYNRDPEVLWHLKKQLEYGIKCQFGQTVGKRWLHVTRYTMGGYGGTWQTTIYTDYIGRASYYAVYAYRLLRKAGEPAALDLADELFAAVDGWVRDSFDAFPGFTCTFNHSSYGINKNVNETGMLDASYTLGGTEASPTFSTTGNKAPNQGNGFLVSAAYLYGDPASSMYHDPRIITQINKWAKLTWGSNKNYIGEQWKDGGPPNGTTYSGAARQAWSFLYASYNNQLMEALKQGLRITHDDDLLSSYFNTVLDDVFNLMVRNFPGWQPNHAYSYGDIVIPTTRGGYEDATRNCVYLCTQAGTSGGSEPTWQTTMMGTQNDGGCVWETHLTFTYPPVYDLHYSSGNAYYGYHNVERVGLRLFINALMTAKINGYAFSDGWADTGIKNYEYFTPLASLTNSNPWGGTQGSAGIDHTDMFVQAIFSDAVIELISVTALSQQVTVDWNATSPIGATWLSYNIHRSTSPSFIVSPDNLVGQVTSSATDTVYVESPGYGTFYYKVVIVTNQSSVISNEMSVVVAPPGRLLSVGTDSAASTDALSMTLASVLQLVEQGVAIDDAFIGSAVTLGLSDIGMGDDVLGLTVVDTLTLTDESTGQDTMYLFVAPTLGLADIGASIDSLSLNIEGEKVRLTLLDNGQSIDTLGILVSGGSFHISLNEDTGSSVDSVAIVKSGGSLRISFVDAGAGVDSLSLDKAHPLPSLGDSSSSSDTVSVGASGGSFRLTLIDEGSGIDILRLRNEGEIKLVFLPDLGQSDDAVILSVVGDYIPISGRMVVERLADGSTRVTMDISGSMEVKDV